MSVVDILVTIIIVTILVTIVLAVVTYVAYKLRLARRPVPTDESGGPRYFDVHAPPVQEAKAGRKAPKPAVAATRPVDKTVTAPVSPAPAAETTRNGPKRVEEEVPTAAAQGGPSENGF